MLKICVVCIFDRFYWRTCFSWAAQKNAIRNRKNKYSRRDKQEEEVGKLKARFTNKLLISIAKERLYSETADEYVIEIIYIVHKTQGRACNKD